MDFFGSNSTASGRSEISEVLKNVRQELTCFLYVMLKVCGAFKTVRFGGGGYVPVIVLN